MKKSFILSLFILILLSSSAYSVYVEDKVIKELEKGDINVIIINSHEKKVYYPKALISKINSHKQLKIINGYAARICKNELQILKDDPNIKGIYFDRKIKLIEPIEHYPSMQLSSATQNIGANYVWENLNFTGKNITISIIDTGIDYKHQDLGNCTQNQFLLKNCSKIIDGYDFVNSDNDPMDDHFHGTHVAGISSANGDLKGTAPDSKLFAVKVLDSEGIGDTSDVILGIEWSINNSANIISMSLGDFEQEYDKNCPLRIASKNAALSGVHVVVAAGNSGPGTSTIMNPGDADNIITVGAYNSGAFIASFSARGPGSFGKLDPEIVAPGVGITSTIPNNGYASHSGTSMAAPFISGSLALMLEKNKSISPNDAKSILMQTSNYLNDKIFFSGAGLVNLTRAFNQKISAQINFSDRWEFSADDNSNASAQITINNKYNYSLNLTLSLQNITDNEQLNKINKSAFILPESFIIEKNSKKNITINFSTPQNTAPSIYGTALIITSNNADIIRLPIVITKTIKPWTSLLSFVDDELNGDALGDWIYYKIKAKRGKYNLFLEWDDINDDFDLYVYDNLLNTIGISGEANTTNESVDLLINSPGYIWAVMNSYTISDTTNYTFSINNANNIPSFLQTPENITISEDTNITIFINATDIDLENITYCINETNFSAINNTGYMHFLPSKDWYGIVNINITISDTYDNNSKTLCINVTPINDAPEINLSAYTKINISEGCCNDTINLSSKINDVDTNKNNLTLNCSSSNDNVVLNIQGFLLNISADEDFNDNSTINCTIFDDNLSDSDIFFVDFISCNDPPIFNSLNNITIYLFDTIEIFKNAADPENDTIIYYINDTRFEEINNSFFYITKIEDIGNFSINVSASDSINMTSQIIHIIVLDNRDFDNDNISNYNDSDIDGDGVDNEYDNIVGNISMINSALNITLEINGSGNYSQNLTGKYLIKLKDSDKTIIEFSHNFLIDKLIICPIEINRTYNDFSQNFIAVKNLQVQWNKTLYLQKSPKYNAVCIKDKEIDSIQNISDDCSGQNETLLYCDGTDNSSYSCEIINLTYNIKGLTHSGVIEFGYCGDGIKNSDEDCDENDFGNLKCLDYGYNSGSLSCNAQCEIAASDCYNQISSHSSSNLVYYVNSDDEDNASNDALDNISSENIINNSDYLKENITIDKNSLNKLDDDNLIKNESNILFVKNTDINKLKYNNIQKMFFIAVIIILISIVSILVYIRFIRKKEAKYLNRDSNFKN